MLAAILIFAATYFLISARRLGLLPLSSTFAGNLTLLGSVANIIVAENARELGGLPFWAYLRVGFPLAVMTTGLGTAWLIAVAG